MDSVENEEAKAHPVAAGKDAADTRPILADGPEADEVEAGLEGLAQAGQAEERTRSAPAKDAKQTPADEDVVGKAYDGRLMRRLITYLRPYKLQTALSAAAIVFKAASDVVGPYLVKVAVDSYMGDGAPARLSWLGRRLSPRPMTGITELAALYLASLLLTYALEFLQTYLMQWTGQKVMFDLRREIFRHMQRMHIGFFDTHAVGKLVTRLTSDVDAINEMFTAGVLAR